MFEPILGQKRALLNLESDLKGGRLAGTYLFAGPESSGKKASALEFAKAINCAGLAPACGECSSCRKADSRSHPEIFVLSFETQAELLALKEEQEIRQKELKIESVRALLSRARLSTLEAKKKVLIIDGAESLSEEAANALLKALEESSSQCVWILVSRSPERIPSTVRSRCRKIWFSPLTSGDIEKILLGKLKRKEKASAIREAALAAEGSMAAALDILDSEALDLAGLAKDFLQGGKGSPFELSSKVVSYDRKLGSRKAAEQFLKFLAGRLSGALRENPSQSKADDLLAVIAAQENLGRNVSPQMVLDELLLSLR